MGRLIVLGPEIRISLTFFREGIRLYRVKGFVYLLTPSHLLTRWTHPKSL